MDGMEDDNENDNKPSNIGLYILFGAAVVILLVWFLSSSWSGDEGLLSVTVQRS